MKLQQSLSAAIVSATYGELEKQSGGKWEAVKAVVKPIGGLLKNRKAVREGSKIMQEGENASAQMSKLLASPGGYAGTGAPRPKAKLEGVLSGGAGKTPTPPLGSPSGAVVNAAPVSEKNLRALKLQEAAVKKQQLADLSAKEMAGTAAKTDPAMLAAQKELALGKRNLGIAGAGAAGLGAVGAGGYGLGHRSGYGEGFGEGGEAGWIGGQQQGLQSAQKAYQGSGFLERLLGSVAPGSRGGLASAQTQQYNPQVLSALKALSQAMQSGQIG